MKTQDISKVLGVAALRPFSPLAYYDKHMDCIRVELRDCSMTERRIDEIFTVLEDNYPTEGQGKSAGIMIKGIKHLFKKLELPVEGIVYVTKILDAIAKTYPDRVADDIQQLVTNIELTVNFDETEPYAMAA